MAAGVPAEAALQLGMSSGTGALTATGSTLATGLTLSANFNLFGTVAASSGAVLPAAGLSGPVVVYNGGASALSVYPQATEFINAGTAGAAFSVTNAKSAVFYPGMKTSVDPDKGAWIAVLSA
jgi:hypothetical protein